MTEKARFTLVMMLRDNLAFEPPIAMAVDVDHEVKISTRAVDEMKIGVGDFNNAVRLMRMREFRKDLFIRTSAQLGTQLAERMEDAEGWHDADRIEPAREALKRDAL